MLTNTIPHTNVVAKMCVGKERHWNEFIAKRAADKRMRKNPGLVLRIYSCPVCGWYHLTSKEERAKAANT